MDALRLPSINPKKLIVPVLVAIAHIILFQKSINLPESEYVKYAEKIPKILNLSFASSIEMGDQNLESMAASTGVIGSFRTMSKREYNKLKTKKNFDDFISKLKKKSKFKRKKVNSKNLLAKDLQENNAKFKKGQALKAGGEASKTALNNSLNQSGIGASKEIISAKDLKLIRSILAKSHPDFRQCYENALLTDKTLKGNIAIFLSLEKPSNKTNIKFKGKGKGNGINALKKCLNSTGAELNFPERLSGNTIKFNLFFNS